MIFWKHWRFCILAPFYCQIYPQYKGKMQSKCLDRKFFENASDLADLGPYSFNGKVYISRLVILSSRCSGGRVDMRNAYNYIWWQRHSWKKLGRLNFTDSFWMFLEDWKWCLECTEGRTGNFVTRWTKRHLADVLRKVNLNW